VLAYNEACKDGLAAHFQPVAEDVSVLDALDALYSDKQFEYIEIGPKTFPVFGPLQHFARGLLSRLLGESEVDRLEPVEPGMRNLAGWFIIQVARPSTPYRE
jgi:hypothetical protein